MSAMRYCLVVHNKFFFKAFKSPFRDVERPFGDTERTFRDTERRFILN